jgi:hypothetical protein
MGIACGQYDPDRPPIIRPASVRTMYDEQGHWLVVIRPKVVGFVAFLYGPFATRHEAVVTVRTARLAGRS